MAARAIRLWASHSARRLSTAVSPALPPAQPPERTFVTIVGGGPVGLYLSLLLSRYGVPHVLCEKSPEARPSPHPRAHLINTRTMELLRQVGLEEGVHAASPPPDSWRRFVYAESVLGAQIASIDHLSERSASWRRLRRDSPSRLAHLALPKLQAQLHAAAQRAADRLGHATLLRGAEVLAVAPAAGGAADGDVGGAPALRVRLALGGGAARELGCEHVVGADGAASVVRRAARIGLASPPAGLLADPARAASARAGALPFERGERVLQHFESVHFRCAELGPLLCGRPSGQGMLYFAFNKHAIGVLVCHDAEEGEWVAQLPTFPLRRQALGEGGAEGGPPASPVAPRPVAEVEALLRGCLGGPPTLRLAVCAVRPWRMVAAVADRLSSAAGECDPGAEGRLHLAGDAAHQFPPSGGFGMNTGMADAHCLAWRLALAHRAAAAPGLCDWAGADGGAALLAPYSAERRHAAAVAAAESVLNFERGLLVPAALGYSHGALQSLLGALGAGTALLARAAPGLHRLLPAGAPQGALDALVRLGLAPLALIPSAAAAADGGAGAGATFGASGGGGGGGGPAGGAGGALRSAAALWGGERVRAARRVVESCAALPLLFPRIELGTHYRIGPCAALPAPLGAAGGAVAAAQGWEAWQRPAAAAAAAAPPAEVLDGVEQYVPSTLPGARMPHAWLLPAGGAAGEGGGLVSSHDLLSLAADAAQPPALLLLVGGAHAGRWRRAAAALRRPHAELLRIAAVCARGEEAAAAAAAAAAEPGARGGDGEGAARPLACYLDVDGTWADVRAVGAHGAVLVRPDGHVAWRGSPGTDEDAARSLARAVWATIHVGGCADEGGL